MRHAVILAGGSGTRLWPASRRQRPKQYLPLGTQASESLLAATVRRLEPICPAEHILVVAARNQVTLVRETLPSLVGDRVLGEPTPRNTAAAIGLAAVHLAHRDPDAVMAVLPADHHIADESGFVRVARRAFAAAEERDVIATIGIVPTRPGTGYGYLEVGRAIASDTGVDAGAAGADSLHAVERFVEKPDLDTATGYLAAGNFLWNAGMFFARAGRWLAEIARHMPETSTVLDAIGDALRTGGRERAAVVTERLYGTLPAISIDHGVMEHASDVVTVRGDFGWNDIGSWDSLGDYCPADEHGNVFRGTVVSRDARDNIVVGEPDRAIALVGVEGLVVVQSGDGILVIPRDRAQDVRAAVAALQEDGLERFL